MRDAELKFYVDADPKMRARRRHAELTETGAAVSLRIGNAILVMFVLMGVSAAKWKDLSRLSAAPNGAHLGRRKALPAPAQAAFAILVRHFQK